jgi:NAD(P)-dependent dehydrogenase (short-subunit alcohol dehydrogenase family)
VNGGLVLITGATGELGPHVVAAFVARGDHVIAVARDRDQLTVLEGAHPPRVRGEVADVTQPKEVEALWKRLDSAGERPQWVVNLVGGFVGGTVLETAPEALARMLDLNLGSAWWSCRAAAQRMQAAGGGAIVNIGARAAVGGGSGSAAYAVAKAGVLRLTQVLAEEMAGTGVRVNAILPGVIDTPTNRATLPPRVMRGAATPEAIAGVILFLCSEAGAPPLYPGRPSRSKRATLARLPPREPGECGRHADQRQESSHHRRRT